MCVLKGINVNKCSYYCKLINCTNKIAGKSCTITDKFTLSCE